LLLGGVTSVAGGINRNAVVLGHNLVCVPLLTLSCYRIGRRVGGAHAGALAVAFALGSPLLIELFHVFMIDAFEASLVALSVWLVLASERFGRLGPAALAGLAVGIGIGTKEQFPLYLVGLVGVVLLRGGWRNVRGFAAFAGIALLVASPWYIGRADGLWMLWRAAGTGEGLLFPVPPLARPPLLSGANVEWYGWATTNGLLFAPLTAFAVVGVAAAIWRLRRRSERSSVVPELLGGLVGSWLSLTILTHKDMRYTLPMIVYLSVLGTAWIVRLPQRSRRLATAGLAAAVIATTLGATFGVGGAIPARLTGNLGAALGVGVPPRHRVVVYANHDYLVSRPRRDGDVLRLLQGLQRIGVRQVYWDPRAAGPEHGDFNGAGLTVLARIAKLSLPRQIAPGLLLPSQALLIYQPVRRGSAPCTRFDDGMSVRVLVGRLDRAVPYCPGRGVLGPPTSIPPIRQAGQGATNLP
jgi:4-amino-4-deoxy-L-arabinose transferase-like glycosyltransferase